MLKGFFRDKMAFFFAVIFPLMFLVLFGGILTDQGESKADIIQVGAVPILDDAPKDAQAFFDKSLEIKKSNERSGRHPQGQEGRRRRRRHAGRQHPRAALLAG